MTGFSRSSSGAPDRAPRQERDEPGAPEDAPVSPAETPGANRPRRGVAVGVIAGGVALIVLATVFAVRIGASKRYVVGTPPRAGGYVLSDPGEHSIAALLASYRSAARATGVRIDTLVYGCYRDPSSPPHQIVPVGAVFVGGTGDIADPETFIQRVRYAPGVASSRDDKVVRTGAGGPGRAACITVGDGPTDTCVWATGHSFGLVTPTNPLLADHAAAVMRKIRPDVEKLK